MFCVDMCIANEFVIYAMVLLAILLSMGMVMMTMMVLKTKSICWLQKTSIEGDVCDNMACSQSFPMSGYMYKHSPNGLPCGVGQVNWWRVKVSLLHISLFLSFSQYVFLSFSVCFFNYPTHILPLCFHMSVSRSPLYCSLSLYIS